MVQRHDMTRHINMWHRQQR